MYCIETLVSSDVAHVANYNMTVCVCVTVCVCHCVCVGALLDACMCVVLCLVVRVSAGDVYVKFKIYIFPE